MLSLVSPMLRVCALASFVLVTACDDGPTAPNVFTHPADGQVWAAILVPEGTPEARTWLPYVRDGRSSGDPAIREIRQLQGEADRLRRSGDAAGAQARDEEAAMKAVGAISQTPPAHIVVIAAASLETWSERARIALHQGEFPDLAERLVQVTRFRTLAREALEKGDTIAAIRGLTAGAAIVREQGPALVAARALIRAEARIASLADTDQDAARALRLLRYSRESLSNGDPVRALRRALYALQLAEQIPASTIASESNPSD